MSPFQRSLLFGSVDQLQPVCRCRSAGRLLGLLDGRRGGESDEKFLAFSYCSVLARGIAISLDRMADALIRIRQSGLF